MDIRTSKAEPDLVCAVPDRISLDMTSVYNEIRKPNYSPLTPSAQPKTSE